MDGHGSAHAGVQAQAPTQHLGRPASALARHVSVGLVWVGVPEACGIALCKRGVDARRAKLSALRKRRTIAVASAGLWAGAVAVTAAVDVRQAIRTPPVDGATATAGKQPEQCFRRIRAVTAACTFRMSPEVLASFRPDSMKRSLASSGVHCVLPRAGHSLTCTYRDASGILTVWAMIGAARHGGVSDPACALTRPAARERRPDLRGESRRPRPSQQLIGRPSKRRANFQASAGQQDRDDQESLHVEWSAIAARKETSRAVARSNKGFETSWWCYWAAATRCALRHAQRCSAHDDWRSICSRTLRGNFDPVQSTLR